MLATQLNEYLSKLAIEHEADYGEATLEEMIADGESEDLEFKSTLRWDMKEGIVNKLLEELSSRPYRHLPTQKVALS